MTFTNREAIAELARQIREYNDVIDDTVRRAAEADAAGDSKEYRRLMKAAEDTVKHVKNLAKEMAKYTS